MNSYVRIILYAVVMGLSPNLCIAMEKESMVNDNNSIIIPFDKGEECCICLVPIVENAPVNKKEENLIETRKKFPITILPCGHSLHTVCAISLVRTDDKCPTCREQFPKDEQFGKIQKENKELRARVNVLQTAVSSRDLPIWQRWLVPGLCSLYMFSQKGDPSFPLVVNKLALGSAALGVAFYTLATSKQVISSRIQNSRNNFFKRFFTTDRMLNALALGCASLLLHYGEFKTDQDALAGIAQAAVTAIGMTAINTILDCYVGTLDQENHLCDMRNLASFLAVVAIRHRPYNTMAALLIKK